MQEENSQQDYEKYAESFPKSFDGDGYDVTSNYISTPLETMSDSNDIDLMPGPHRS